MRKFFLLFMVMVLFPIACYCQTSELAFEVSWSDTMSVKADHYTVYKAGEPEGIYVADTMVTDTFYVDHDIENDVRVWYKVSATIGYIESDFSGWVSGRAIDLTGGQFDTDRIVAYYPENDMVMLVIYPPINDCELNSWQYMIPDMINIRCGSQAIGIPIFNKLE